MTAPILTAARLRELLDYSIVSGRFYWRDTRNGRVKIGSIAGSYTEGYLHIQVDGFGYGASRLAVFWVTGEWPTGTVDHINRVRDFNAWINLRDITHRMNTENIEKSNSRNKLGVLGVSQHHRSNRFRASIRVDGKLHRLGWFDTKEEAHVAYLEAKRRLHAGCTI